MYRLLRPILLFVAALFMLFAVFINFTVSVPHLREDMEEINVRPTLLSAVMLGLHFGTFAMTAFVCIVLVAAIQSLRGTVTARVPLLILGITYVAFGVLAFALSRSHHTLGYVLMGLLVIGGVAIPEPH